MNTAKLFVVFSIETNMKPNRKPSIYLADHASRIHNVPPPPSLCPLNSCDVTKFSNTNYVIKYIRLYFVGSSSVHRCRWPRFSSSSSPRCPRCVLCSCTSTSTQHHIPNEGRRWVPIERNGPHKKRTEWPW